ncbi:MAG TPA: hypothetical protein VFE17_06725 [Candidatus Baltobacteraceae bacterium]|jgi:hypothetical protein|nr:hypothetical protein [Candidatus Baltobacteraceae bacterium]
MHRIHRHIVMICMLFVMGPLTAAAQAPAPVVTPINVLSCQVFPPNVVVDPAFVPGYFPAAPPYTWTDIYGYPYVEVPLSTTDGTLAIDFMNVAPIAAKTVEFGLIARGRLVAETRDVGTFSPNVEIKHKYGLDPNVFPLGTALPVCTPLRVTFADNTKWINPHLPALVRSLYHP